MFVIVESITAGLIFSSINNYRIGKHIVETCMPEEEEDSEVVSVATGVSDSSTTHHVHG